MIHAIALRLHRVTGAGSFLSTRLHVFVTNDNWRGCWSSKSRLRRGVAALDGVSSGVHEDDPLAPIGSLLSPISRSTGAVVAVAAVFAIVVA